MSSIKSEIFKGLAAKLVGKYKTRPEDQEQFVQEFADSLKISQGYQGAEAFNELANNHIGSIEALAEQEQQNQKKPKDDDAQKSTKKGDITKLNKQIKSKLKKEDKNEKQEDKPAKTFNDAFTKALSLTDETRTAQKEYNQCIAEVNRMIKESAVFDTAALASYLHEAKSSAVDAIKAQHKKESDELNATLTNHGDAFKKTLDIDDPTIEKKTRDKLTNALKKNHKEQLAAFEKSTESSIEALHTEAQKERDRIAFIAMLYHNNKEVRNYIHLENQKEGAGNISISLDANTQKASFKNIKVENLPVITSITGRKIEKNQDNSFSMDLPNRFFSLPQNIGYHSSYRTAREADLMSMAQAVKACGYDSIEMDVSGVKPEQAQKLIMASYAACRKSGFPADKISIKYNGQEKIQMDNNQSNDNNQMKIDDFIKKDSTYTSIEAEANNYNKQRQNFQQQHQDGNKIGKKTTEELRDTLKKYREEKSENTAEPDDQTPDNQTTRPTQ